MNPDSLVKPLGRLVGTWTTEATHPAVPGVVVRGTAVIEWVDGERFLAVRARNDHPDFPDSLSVIGHMGSAESSAPAAAGASPLRMHYFDSRGVFRVYEVGMDETEWRWWRDAPEFSQRFTGRLSEDGTTIAGHSQLRMPGGEWADDLQITYRRA